MWSTLVGRTRPEVRLAAVFWQSWSGAEIVIRGASVSGDASEPHFLHEGVRSQSNCDRTIRMFVFRIVLVRDERSAPEVRSVHSIGVNFRHSLADDRVGIA